MTYTVTLTATKGGIDRERTEGSPSKNVLYDFVNGYRNQGLKAVVRPGTRCVNDLPIGQTKGFIIYRGTKYVFSHTPQAMSGGVVCEVLTHPSDSALAIKRIWFAGPFLQFLYVVAEFTNGDIYDYWLQSAATWTANTAFQLGSLVQPIAPNGYIYQARRIGDPNPLWTRDLPRTVGDRVEPTVADGNYYEVVDTLGASPRSGAVEPTWNTADGALTYEDVEGANAAPDPGTGPTTPPTTPGTTIIDRYRNQAGPLPDGGFRSVE